MMSCIFSGEEADTQEHVIPLWLQKRLKLSNQTLYLPNGTKLKYKHAKVPAKVDHNNKFAEIEDRISRGILIPQEVYLWALKIHIGLLYRDTSLKWSIADPGSPTIRNVGEFESDIYLFQALYRAWSKGGEIDPNPFGSVFIIDSCTEPHEFDLIHCLITGTVAIDIGTKFILVMLWDKSMAMGSNALAMWEDHHLPRIRASQGTPEEYSQAYLAHHAWSAEVAYYVSRYRTAMMTVSSDNGVSIVPSPRAPRPKEFKDEKFDAVCLNFGLERAVEARSGEYIYTQRRPPPVST